jgi:hypothetical protein
MPLVENVAKKPVLGKCKVCGFCRRLSMVKEAISKA